MDRRSSDTSQAVAQQSAADRRRNLGRRTDDLLGGSSASGWSMRDLYRVLFRYWKRSLLFFVTVMTLTATGLIVCPKTYTSEAWLFVRLGRESVALDPTATTGNFVGPNVTRDSEINSIIEVMGSRIILEQVVAKIGLDPPASTELAQEQGLVELMKDIRIWSPKETNVIGVSCEANSPKRAQLVVQTIIETYRDEHLRLNSTPGSLKFFEEQAELLKGELEKNSQQLRDMKSRFQLASIDGRRDALQKQIALIESQIDETESNIAASEAKINSLRAGYDKLPAEMVKQLAIEGTEQTGLRELLYQLQTREQELLAKYTEIHPDVIAIRQQVREAKQILDSEQPDHSQATTAAVLKEQSLLDSERAKQGTLSTQLSRLQQNLSELNDHEVKIRELERRVKVAETNYLAHMSSLEQARIIEALQHEAISNINIIQPANLRHKAVKPKKAITLAAALLFGMCGAVGIAFLSEQLDHSLRSPEEMERYLQLPALASIPRMPPRELVLKGVV